MTFDIADDLAEPAAPDVAEGAPPAVGVAFMDLEPGQCRWPLGNLSDRRAPVADRFCGEPAIEGKSYCPRCHRRAYRPFQPHKSAAIKMHVDRRR